MNAAWDPGAFIILANEHNAIVDLQAQGHGSDGAIMIGCAALLCLSFRQPLSLLFSGHQ